LLAALVAGLAALGLVCVVAFVRREPIAREPIAEPQALHLVSSAHQLTPGEQLAYAFYWNGIRGATARTWLSEVVADGKTWLVLGYEGHTADEIAWVWRYDVSGKTYVDPATLLPARSVVTSTKKDKVKRRTTTFDRTTGVATTVTEKLYRNSRSEKSVAFEHGLDLMSGLLFARALELQAGETVVMEVLHEDKTYAVELTAGQTEEVKVAAGTFEAIPLVLRARPEGGSEEEQQAAQSKYRSVRIWLSVDGHVPLKMEADVILGKVHAELVSLRRPPAGDRAP